MTISIVIPCYNEEENIPPCLVAILGQTEPPEEVIFVNNNSTDNSRAVAESFMPKFQEKGINFQIFDVAEQGIVPARIVGYGAVENDLIGSIDIDTIIDRNWVKTAKNYFFNNLEIVGCGGPLFFSNRGLVSKIRLMLNFFLYKIINKSLILWGCNSIFRKNIYKNISGFNGYNIFFSALHLDYPYSDNFLTERFRRCGKISFIFSLRASGVARGGMGRPWRQSIDFWRIKYYFWKKYKV
ncbi:MAG: glycosyltransferase family 2 protein [Patescibacteria group bacterium]|nr:glycosyltransferase family 2 protein [Patescibacteria group bacterium]